MSLDGLQDISKRVKKNISNGNMFNLFGNLKKKLLRNYLLIGNKKKFKLISIHRSKQYDSEIFHQDIKHIGFLGENCIALIDSENSLGICEVTYDGWKFLSYFNNRY